MMQITRKKKVLIVTAVEAEKEAVKRGVGDDARFELLIGGVGPVAAGIHTTLKLAAELHTYELVVNIGIGGGFTGHADIESLVVASHIIAGDLGSETQDGFLSLDELGFGTAHIDPDAARARLLVDALQTAGLTASYAPIVTVSTTTGTLTSAQALQRRVPHAAAEAMEGFGVAAAASACGLPVLEIRAISNAVGPRDRENWCIKEALQRVTSASAILKEVL